MIAKHIPMRVVKKSDFRELVEYLNDPQTKQERVGKLTVTNCQQDNPLDAALEVQATQAINTRTEDDKTYHLIISFREGEKPTPEVLEAIEARVCAALGYGDHQRVSAVHHDTDNLHIHVAINKIHPTRYTIHTPYNDYKTLGDICEKLEREYGLEQDNHTARKGGAENRAADMERHAGVESLLGWIKRECADQIKSAQGWAELHEVMRSNGLELRERGNGLVITDGAGVGVKASSVARELSKAKLEERFGAFEAPAVRAASADAIKAKRAAAPPVGKVGQKPPPRSQNRLHSLSGLDSIHIDGGRRYEQRPMHAQKINTVELHARYKAEQQDLGAARTAAIGQARAKKDRLIEAAKRSGRLKRAAIKLLNGPGVNKKLLYALTSKAHRADVEKINAQYLKERNAAYDGHHRRAWADWLQAKATQGDAEALAALRAREARQGRKRDTVGGHDARRAGPVPGLTPDSITKAGTVIYRVGATAIRDDGELLNVSRGAGQHGLEAALRMAMYRYGDRITVNGSADFKERIAQVAAAAKLNVTFDDAALEQRRQDLVRASTTKEQNHEQRDTQRTPERNAAEPGGPDRSRDAAPRANGPERAGRATRAGRPARVGRGVRGPGGANKPDIGRVGRTPPPESKNRLRNLSQLGVVQLAHGSEVLLPRDVPNHVEQQGTQPDNGLRRDIRGTGGISASAATLAADKYIAEREGKRAKGFDIPKHRRYNDHDEGAAKFAGIRQVGSETLALLKRDDDVIVLPVDAATARRMKRLSVGDDVSLTGKGTVRTKGRSR
ncbi:Protein TraI [Paraburkholderia aspalathi]|uniref:Protein TraI n=1 Tax=Paraburkholderia aspalathi TaxID=1324617 RepID=A0ABN7MQJ5_9BURK|nr:TraI/MobA(P) family conjugative relaxase [Paraburkholderia aspalathi]MBK3822219.1 relaxase/mobilization nuclease domain-containing protein [Paraburkholderia aspalathi]MBK3834069.1 relaxase/mobilization nuclease domain-containing protein [Paraburkholderia aspalathi]MBK3863817.1 relaxase/mobilization nuclease domain-containing protein [Paraburkholderia aspalathi]CAE6823255.1 Protein TraI [Paraburkholderia aspalathi]